MKPMKRAAVALMLLWVGSAQAADDVMVVFDGSNSMWGQIDGVAKIEIARQAMERLVGNWTDGTNVGLMAYGHRREGDCSDIETMITPGPFVREAFLERVRSITPRGKTPLTTAVEQAAEALAYRDRPATVVLITDGIESCQRDPCALAEELERMGVGFTAHVVGFDLKGEEQEAVACMAERTGGRFVAARNAEELGAALSTVGTAVAEAPEPTPEPEPAPAPSVVVEAPESAVIGSSFAISWQAPTQAPRDYVTIVPLGADEGTYTNYQRVQDKSEGSLRAPAEPGLYEVRYVRQEDGSTLSSTEIEIVEADVSVSAPQSATAGERFSVSWSGAVHPRDYVTIVPAGAAEGDYGDYTRVGDKSEGSLRAPAEPGLYEVRYVLQEGGKTLSSVPIEIVEADIELAGPDTVRAGSQIRVVWSGSPPHGRDYVTIVPMGAQEGAYGDYVRVGGRDSADLSAPEETGLYEVRYVLDEGKRILARHPVEVVAATAALNEGGALEAPEAGKPGETVEVRWTAEDSGGDRRVTLAGADQPDFTWIEAKKAEGPSLTFTLPQEAGFYEFRLLDIPQRKVLSRVTIRVE